MPDRSTTCPTSRDTNVSVASDPDVSFLLLRAFYDLRGTLERLLIEHDLDQEIQPGMGPILYALYEQDGGTIRDLGERVRLAKSTLTNTLKRMERTGLVQLQSCPDDGRAIRVHLTRRGRALETEMNALRNDVQRTLHGDMNDRDLKQIKSLLHRVIDSMERRRD